MTKKQFINHDDIILDNYGEQLISTDEIVDKLNQFHYENKRLGAEVSETNYEYNMLILKYQKLEKENKELQFQCNLLREQSNEFHRGARENANRVGQLKRENKKLKAFLKELEDSQGNIYHSNGRVYNIKEVMTE